jgi:cyclohexadienyl dehydratase
MRIVLAIIFLWVFVSDLGSLEAGESHLHEVLERGELRVGTTGDFRPMSIRDVKTGAYEGYDIDVVRQLASDMGVELKFVATDWKTLVNGILADKYDMTTSASVSVSRAKVAGYTSPYIYFGTVPMSLKENVGKYGSDWSDLDREGVKVATTLGTVFESQARKFFKHATIVTVESPAREYQEVLSGRADLSLTSNIDAANLRVNHPSLTVVPLKAPLTSSPGAFLVSQEDQVWLNFLNHWLELKKATSFFKDLNAKWLGE